MYRNGGGAILVHLFGHKKNLQGWNIIPCRFFFAERGSRGHRPRCAQPPRTPCLARSILGKPKWRSCRATLFFVSKHISIQQVDVHVPIYKKTSPIGLVLHFVLRRERDSNPRSLSAQRFSRPPQSTTLPSLLVATCLQEETHHASLACCCCSS